MVNKRSSPDAGPAGVDAGRRRERCKSAIVSLAAAAALLASAVEARPVTPAPVRVGVAPARMALLTPGVRRYLRYSIKGDRRSTIDIWTRTVAFTSLGGVRRLHLTQEWDRVVAPSSVLRQDAWFDAETFAPITHVRTAEQDGVVTTAGYRFRPGEVVGMTELPQNSRQNFRAAAPEPPFNFEYDMELLQTLPWRKGYVANIVFYDPGREPPAHYLFKQAGETGLTGADGRATECWLVTADYNTGHVLSRFWIDKRTQVVVHEESERDGLTYVKTLLAAESSDSRN